MPDDRKSRAFGNKDRAVLPQPDVAARDFASFLQDRRVDRLRSFANPRDFQVAPRSMRSRRLETTLRSPPQPAKLSGQPNSPTVPEF
jgi:hypothetical protein